MMEELRRKADATQGSVSTFTRKIPLGLGNLGFKYVPKPRDLFNLYYNYDSQEQSDESPIGQEVPAE